jgi:hypothetical protein
VFGFSHTGSGRVKAVGENCPYEFLRGSSQAFLESLSSVAAAASPGVKAKSPDLYGLTGNKLSPKLLLNGRHSCRRTSKRQKCRNEMPKQRNKSKRNSAAAEEHDCNRRAICQERISRLPQTIVPTHHQPNIGHVRLRDIDAVGGAHDDDDELLSAIAKVSLV